MDDGIDSGREAQAEAEAKARLVHLVLLGSSLLYVPVAWVLARGGGAPGGGDAAARTVGYALAGAALSLMALIPLVRGRLAPPPGARDAQRAFTADVAAWALCESIAVLGLVAALLTRDFRFSLALSALSVLAFVLQRPR